MGFLVNLCKAVQTALSLSCCLICLPTADLHGVWRPWWKIVACLTSPELLEARLPRKQIWCVVIAYSKTFCKFKRLACPRGGIFVLRRLSLFLSLQLMAWGLMRHQYLSFPQFPCLSSDATGIVFFLWCLEISLKRDLCMSVHHLSFLWTFLPYNICQQTKTPRDQCVSVLSKTSVPSKLKQWCRECGSERWTGLLAVSWQSTWQRKLSPFLDSDNLCSTFIPVCVVTALAHKIRSGVESGHKFPVWNYYLWMQ